MGVNVIFFLLQQKTKGFFTSNSFEQEQFSVTKT
jgi:hypothetical protein